MPNVVLKEFKQNVLDDVPLINHFALMTKFKGQYPLHYAAFRQFAPAPPHEGNVERVNSAAKLAADPNLDAEKLSRRVYISQNMETYPFSLEEVKAKYIQKFGSLRLDRTPATAASLKDGPDDEDIFEGA